MSETSGSIYCDECEWGFSRRSAFIKHKRKVHHAIIPPLRRGRTPRYVASHCGINGDSGFDTGSHTSDATAGGAPEEPWQKNAWWEREPWFDPKDWCNDYYWECKRLLPKIFSLPLLNTLDRDREHQTDVSTPKFVDLHNISGNLSTADICDILAKRKYLARP